jgi:H+/gluconate symporter-like permease
MKKWTPTKTFVVAMPATSIFGVALLALGYQLSPSDQLALTWVVCFTGYMLGMPLGMLISPHKGEGHNFRLLGSYLITFFSGYVVSKLTSAGVEKWVAEAVSNSLRSGRIMLFLSSFVLGVVQTFILRAYLEPEREQDLLAEQDGKLSEGLDDQVNSKTKKRGAPTA